MTTPTADDEPTVDRLFREGYGFDFFQAVRLLEWAYPDRRPVGEDGPPSAEVVRFVVHQSLIFPPSSIDQLTPSDGETPARMAVNFFGLTGPSGVLPMHYTQMVIAQKRAADNPERRATGDWFDLFNHRMLGLFYRAWTKYRLPIAFERAAKRGERDPVTRVALSLIGLGTPGLEDRLEVDPDSADGAVDDLALVRYAGLFAHPVRSAAGLERLLSDYFERPVVVEQFQGHWVRLDPENQTAIGATGANTQLGESVVVGRRYWDVQGRFLIRLGPLDYAAFIRWLPDRDAGGTALFLLAELARFYIRDALDFHVRLELRAADVPACQLRNARPGPRLGWNVWLGKPSGTGIVDDPVFSSTTLISRAARPARP